MRTRNNLEFYDQSAERWWSPDTKVYALHSLNAPRFSYFDRYIQNWQGLNVLDVGCGGGFSCEFLAARGAIVSGVDQSQACIDAARAHAMSNGWAIDYQRSVAEQLPYPDHSFDAVICVDVLEHVTDLNQTIREIDRVLRPGGFFGFDTVNRTFKSKLIMIWLLEELLHEIPHGIHDWQKFITPTELSQLMSQLGFNNIDIKGFNLFGSTIKDNVLFYLHYKKTGEFNISIDEDSSVMYIGKAEKSIAP